MANKYAQLYDIPSFQRLAQSHHRPGFTDALAGVVLARNLEALDPNILEVQYPDLALVNSGIDVDNSGGYAARISSLRLRDVGGFRTANDTAGNKGKITLTGEGSELPVTERQAHSEWGDTEAKQAEMQNLNLVSRFISAANRIYLEEVDTFGFLGIAGYGDSYGLLNSPLVTQTVASDTAENMTGEELYNELASLITGQRTAVNNVTAYSATRLVVPLRVMNLLPVKFINTAGGMATVAEALRTNFPDVTISATHHVDNVNVPGVTGLTSVAVAYRPSNDVMKLRVPLPLQVGEIVKQSSFDYRLDYKYRYAGLDLLEPTGARRLIGL